MKAAVLTEINKIELLDLEIPSCRCGQVRVRVEAATICGAQIAEIFGTKGNDPYLPHLLGHEGYGEVMEIGLGVSTVVPGDKVILHWRPGRGINADPPLYMDKDFRRFGAGPVATFAEEIIVSENRCTSIPHNSGPAEVLSLLGCAVTTAFGIVNNEAGVRIGESVAVAGVGGVGMNVVQAARLVGAYPVIAIDRDDLRSKLNWAIPFGADYTYTSIEYFSSDNPHIKVDVFVDCTGDKDVINKGFRNLKPGGRLILVGQPPAGDYLIFSNARNNYVGKTILDSQGGLTIPDEDIPRYLELYKQGRIQLDQLITHRFPLSEIRKAVDIVENGRCMRVALIMGGE
jgi:S-(hydroxymethyl)glutathione dehydrogenase/alcohol dehydrogenase